MSAHESREPEFPELIQPMPSQAAQPCSCTGGQPAAHTGWLSSMGKERRVSSALEEHSSLSSSQTPSPLAKYILYQTPSAVHRPTISTWGRAMPAQSDAFAQAQPATCSTNLAGCTHGQHRQTQPHAGSTDTNSKDLPAPQLSPLPSSNCAGPTVSQKAKPH